MARMKAYQVSDGNDGCVIQFATNSATARREGAGEIGCDWEDIDYCNRRPELDQLAPGPVPPAVLIEHGWWFECHSFRCYERVTQDTENRIVTDYAVYCCKACSEAAPPAATKTEGGE